MIRILIKKVNINQIVESSISYSKLVTVDNTRFTPPRKRERANDCVNFNFQHVKL